MKKITLVIAMFAMAMAASAQYTGHKFFDNWSIGAEGGVSTNLHDWDTPNGAVAGINFTKGITPVVSFEFQLQAGFNDDANWNWAAKSKNVVDNASVYANTKINLMNWFGGYKGTPRLFEIQARGGVGYTRFFWPSFNGIDTSSGNDLNRCNFKFGLDFDFNLGEKKAWTISLRPAVIVKTSRDNDPLRESGRGMQVVCDKGSGCTAYGHNCIGQITAGVTYHFKTSNGTHYFTEVKPVEITKTVEKIVDRPVEKVVEKVVEKIVTKNVGGSMTVEFAQNKATLSNTAKAKLNTIDKSTTVVIDGYASPEGAKAYNLKLSQRRCDAVKAYLEDRGVKVADAKAHGAEGPESQRVVYVTVK